MFQETRIYYFKNGVALVGMDMFSATSNGLYLYFGGTSKKIETTTSTSRPILTIDKLLKITMIYDKMLTICEIFREKAATWHALEKIGNGWMCTMDEKRWSLYKWDGRM